MKVAISSSGKNLDAQIDPRFGRCEYFVIVETDDMSFEVFANEGMAVSGGAGIQAAMFVVSKGAKVVITGNIGPNAVSTFSAEGLEVITGQSGTVRKAVDDYNLGKLSATNAANVSKHHGMSQPEFFIKNIKQNGNGKAIKYKQAPIRFGVRYSKRALKAWTDVNQGCW